MKKYIKHLLLFLILLGLDQAAKLWVRFNLQDNKKIDIIRDVLNIQFHDNSGAIWGILDGQIGFLVLFTLIVLSLIVYLYFKIPDSKRHRVLKTIVVFIIAGAVGNLIDRIYLGYVVDFIYFELIHFPLFNLADSYLTVSSILVLLLTLFYYKDEDFAFLDKLFRIKKKKADGAEVSVSAKIESLNTELTDEESVNEKSANEKAMDNESADKVSVFNNSDDEE